MTKHIDLAVLRSLDAAPSADLDETGRRRSEARLHQILTSVPFDSGTGRPKRRPRTLRWAVVTGAAAALATVTWLAPGALGPDAAYASWTALPEEIAPADQAVADAACRDAGLRLQSPALVLAERRGEWVVLLYAGTHAEFEGSPSATACMAHLVPGGDHAENVDLGTAGGQGAVPRERQFTQGPIFEFKAGPWPFGPQERPAVSLTLGDAGDEVAGVMIHTADGQTIEASVDNGRYVAWWPGPAVDNGLDQPAGEGGPRPTFTYSVKLSDGTTVADAIPTTPK